MAESGRRAVVRRCCCRIPTNYTVALLAGIGYESGLVVPGLTT